MLSQNLFDVQSCVEHGLPEITVTGKSPYLLLSKYLIANREQNLSVNIFGPHPDWFDGSEPLLFVVTLNSLKCGLLQIVLI